MTGQAAHKTGQAAHITGQAAQMTGRPAEMSEPPISSTAGAELADRLRQAWVRAGRPHMERIGDEVGYSKATISKVLSGKMPPAWHLVRKLGVLLRVPATVIAEEWHPLWIAADGFRRATLDAGQDRTAEPAGRICDRCGSWVIDFARHTEWHLSLEDRSTVKPTDSHEWVHLRDAVSRRKKS
jgi:transcriptional regulator with XRE-family HTH domain